MADHSDDPLARLQAIQVQPTSYSEFAAMAQSAADHLQALGIRYRGTRFHRYLEFLQVATQRTYPRTVDWTRDRKRQLYEAEAIGQCVQLASAVGLENRVDRSLLQQRLRNVLAGSDVLENDDADDRPRNL